MVYLGPLSPVPDDNPLLLAARARAVDKAVASFIASNTAEECASALATLQMLLPPGIRVLDDHGGLYVYYDQGITIPKFLAHAASYIEMQYPDGRAEVKKGGFGPAMIKSTEPIVKSAIDRLLEDDDLV
jgi:hypothetical protein